MRGRGVSCVGSCSDTQEEGRVGGGGEHGEREEGGTTAWLPVTQDAVGHTLPPPS